MFNRGDIEEFKRFCKVHHNRDLPDEEATKMTERVIRFLIATMERPQKMPSLTTEEATAFDFIKTGIESNNPPSTRTIAAELGFSSSRSGHRVVGRLIKKGIVSRNPSGALEIL